MYIHTSMHNFQQCSRWITFKFINLRAYPMAACFYTSSAIIWEPPSSSSVTIPELFHIPVTSCMWVACYLKSITSSHKSSRIRRRFCEFFSQKSLVKVKDADGRLPRVICFSFRSPFSNSRRTFNVFAEWRRYDTTAPPNRACYPYGLSRDFSQLYYYRTAAG